MNRDPYYFRVQRNNKWINICFSDMTLKEINECTKNKPVEWWKELAIGLKKVINDMENELNEFYNDEKERGIESMGYF